MPQVDLELSDLKLIFEALIHSTPKMSHYPEPNERHEKAIEVVRAAIEKIDG